MIYIHTETAFANYPWCRMIMRGIYNEVKRKRIAYKEVASLDEIQIPNSCVLLPSATREWINTAARKIQDRGCHPIVLSNRFPNVKDQSLSSIMMDIHGSMQLAVDYLHALGRERLCLYSVNPNSSSDVWRADVFQKITGRGDHVYYNDVSLDDTFHRFYQSAQEYDGVICVNDYAAVSLVKRLRQLSFPVPEKLYIVSYGNMNISQLCQPSITSISDDYEHFGKAALAACSLIERNSTISTINIHLHSKLNIRATTEFRPYIPEHGPGAENIPADNSFYRDPEVASLARLETLFNQCDETDHTLIRLLMENRSFSAIAQACFISETAAKYRVKKMEKLCGVTSREALCAVLKDFF